MACDLLLSLTNGDSAGQVLLHILEGMRPYLPVLDKKKLLLHAAEPEIKQGGELLAR